MRYCASESRLLAEVWSRGVGRRRELDARGELAAELRRKLQPLGAPRRDWSDNEFNLGSTMEDEPVDTLRNAIASWRVMLPRLASDTIVGTFLRHDASAWVLFTDQIGGRQDDIDPVAPTTL